MTGHSKHDRPPRWSRWRIAAWSVATLMLLLPFVAGAPWTVSDYVLAAALVLGVGIPLDLVMRKTSGSAYRWAATVALATAFLLVWAIGAVGVIGSEANAVNLLYYGVLAVGLVGAFMARFRPRGMTRAMAAAALAQATIAAGALVAGLGAVAKNGPLEVVAVNGLFVALWVGSAALFRKAARPHPPSPGAPTS